MAYLLTYYTYIAYCAYCAYLCIMTHASSLCHLCSEFPKKKNDRSAKSDHVPTANSVNGANFSSHIACASRGV